MVQYTALLGQLSKKVNWDVSVSALSVSGKLDETSHPLHPSVSRMKDRKALNTMNMEAFINRVNKTK